MSNDNFEICPLCKIEGVRPQTQQFEVLYTLVTCERCGTYITDDFAIETDLTSPELSSKLYLLSALTRLQPRTAPLKVVRTEIDRLIDVAPRHSVAEKMVLAIRLLEDLTTHPGESIRIEFNRHYPLVFGRNLNELKFLVDQLVGRGYLVHHSSGSSYAVVTIQAEGWQWLEEIGKTPAFENRAFVAMAFRPEMFDVFKAGIKPAIEECGYEAFLVNDNLSGEMIDNRIIAGIRDCRFLVADFTHHRNGVYFEAGFAMGLGRPVIWLVNESDVDNLHFDTRQFPHIVWKDAKDLNEQLVDCIAGRIGRKS